MADGCELCGKPGDWSYVIWRGHMLAMIACPECLDTYCDPQGPDDEPLEIPTHIDLPYLLGADRSMDEAAVCRGREVVPCAECGRSVCECVPCELCERSPTNCDFVTEGF
jgi:hypothetical protein